MLVKFITYKTLILDLIFPKFCLGCAQEGAWLCRSCQRKIVLVKTQLCPKCGKISAAGRFCPKCAKGRKLKGIIVAAYYEEGPLRELIHNFKYNHILAVGPILSSLLKHALQENLPAGAAVVSFVPTHWLRRAKRGYNQAEILALDLSRSTELPLQKTLIKGQATKRQVELTGQKRRHNLQHVFRPVTGLKLKGKKIILVDDIATTGTTLNECAVVLKAAGAREVWGLVVARG